MEDISRNYGLKNIVVTLFATFIFSFLTLVVKAQNTVPEKVDVDIDVDRGTLWYAQPWVWAIGIAVFIIILVAITRSGRRAD